MELSNQEILDICPPQNGMVGYFKPSLHLSSDIKLFESFFKQYIDKCLSSYKMDRDRNYINLIKQANQLRIDVLNSAEKQSRKYTPQGINCDSFKNVVIAQLVDNKDRQVDYSAIDNETGTYQTVQRWFIIRFLNIILKNAPPERIEYEFYLLYFRKRCLQLSYRVANSKNHEISSRKFSDGHDLTCVLNSEINRLSKFYKLVDVVYDVKIVDGMINGHRCVEA